MAPPGLSIGAAWRPYPGETESGDAYAVHWSQGVCRISVIDGLGHGPLAALAARHALEVLAAYPDAAPGEALRLCHRALQGTRGAAVTVVRIDLDRAVLTYAGVGNVEGRYQSDGTEAHFMAYRGIVGSVMPTVRELEITLADEWTVVLHTDGIRARFALAALPPAASAQQHADGLLAECARPTDDATVVVIHHSR